MHDGLWILLSTAVSVAFIHTLIGVDHSLPFVVLGRAQGWPLRKLLVITSVCGLGHVLSSIVLGFLGIGLGVAVERLKWVETTRGSVSAWLLISFGLVYASWGIYRSLRNRPHHHVHFHDAGPHAHEHHHADEHLHPHRLNRRALTVWTLFIVFVFGPCEPLIPLLMVPALSHDWTGVALVSTVFGTVTIGTMLALVTVGFYGFRPSYFAFLERHVHAVAGLMIAASGVAIKALGI